MGMKVYGFKVDHKQLGSEKGYGRAMIHVSDKVKLVCLGSELRTGPCRLPWLLSVYSRVAGVWMLTERRMDRKSAQDFLLRASVKRDAEGWSK